MKIIRSTLISVSLLLFFLLIILNNSSENQTNIVNTTENISKYSEVTKNFKAIDVNAFENLLKKEEKVYVYFGRKSCPYCREFVPELWKIAKKEKGNNLLYRYRKT